MRMAKIFRQFLNSTFQLRFNSIQFSTGTFQFDANLNINYIKTIESELSIKLKKRKKVNLETSLWTWKHRYFFENLIIDFRINKNFNQYKDQMVSDRLIFVGVKFGTCQTHRTPGKIFSNIFDFSRKNHYFIDCRIRSFDFSKTINPSPTLSF